MPALSHLYGIKPSDLDVMAVDEINEYLAQLDEYEREMKRKAEEVNRGN